VKGGEVPILYGLDVVKDRLAAYFHWQDKPALVQALTVMLSHDITPSQIESFCEREQAHDEYKFIMELYANADIRKLSTMDAVENIVLRESLKRL